MITQYVLMIDRSEDNHPYLVKEASLDYSGDCLNCPNQIAEMLNKCFCLDTLAEEFLFLVVMDTAGHPLGVFSLAHGSVNEAPVGVREMFIRILLCGGSCFALAHNHPSGSVQPSSEDFNVCKRVKEASTMMGVKMLDFLIIGSGCFLSFSREDLL